MNKFKLDSEFEKVRQLPLLIQSDFPSKIQSVSMKEYKK